MNLDPKSEKKNPKLTNDSWRTDETYIEVKGQWKYLYRAVDSMGKTIDFMLSENRDMPAAKRFFTKALSSPYNQIPRVITLDKNPAYPPAIQELITAEQTLKGIEDMHMIRKGQAEYNSSVLSAVEWLNKIFGIVA
jgi:IS6 family transposase